MPPHNETLPCANSAHILKLNIDLLWHIFNSIAEDSFSERVDPWAGPFHKNLKPHGVVRRASQVCGEWRKLILRSPSIWGKVVDLGCLGQDNDDWRKEFMMRTGKSLLWIRGVAGFVEWRSGQGGERLFEELLAEEWHRIERINVHTGGESYSYDILRCPSLRQPTQYLVEFTLDIGPSKVEPEIYESLFANKAPALRHFNSNCLLRLLHLPRYSHLHTLDIRLESVVEVSKFFSDCCSAASSLKFLGINTRYGSTRQWLKMDDLPLTPVSFLKLERIEIDGDLSAAHLILRNIISPSDCTLHSSLVYRPGREDDAFRTIVKKYGSGCFQKYNQMPQSLSILYGCNGIVIGDINRDKSRASSHFFFKTNVAHEYPNHGHHSTSAFLLSVFPLDSLSNVTSLDISSGSFIGIQTRNPSVLSFFAALNQVTTLSTHPYSLLFFVDFPPELSIFPLLRILQAVGRIPITYRNIGALESFILWRQELGVPIGVFDLTCYNEFAPSALAPTETLEKFTGLTVKWGLKASPQEYVCGTGNMVELRWLHELLLYDSD